MSGKPQQNLPSFKVVVVGESGVGKTNILTRFLKDKFFINQPNTIGVEFSTKIVELEGEKVKFMLWDTAGQEKYRAVVSAYYRNAAGALMVFDLTHRESFNKLDRWITEIQQQTANGITILLIGNKSDLPNRQVTTDEALQFAQRHKMAYMETSALLGTNVQTAFLKLLTQIYALQKKQSQQGTKISVISKKSLISLSKQEENNKKGICC